MAAKQYVVLTGALSLVDGEARYKNDLVSADEIGDQVDRHLKNEAIREATAAEAKAGRAATPGDELTLEDQIENEKAGIESSHARIKQLEKQIVERDARLDAAAKKAAGVVKAEAKTDAKK